MAACSSAAVRRIQLRAGTSPSIQTRTNARIAAELEDAPSVATLESSRLDFLILDRRNGRCGRYPLAEMRSPSATDGVPSDCSPPPITPSPAVYWHAPGNGPRS